MTPEMLMAARTATHAWTDLWFGLASVCLAEMWRTR